MCKLGQLFKHEASDVSIVELQRERWLSTFCCSMVTFVVLILQRGPTYVATCEFDKCLGSLQFADHQPRFRRAFV